MLEGHDLDHVQGQGHDPFQDHHHQGDDLHPHLKEGGDTTVEVNPDLDPGEYNRHCFTSESSTYSFSQYLKLVLNPQTITGGGGGGTRKACIS